MIKQNDKKSLVNLFLKNLLVSFSLLFFLLPVFSLLTANAQDLLFDEQIKAFAITRFERGFTERQSKILWAAFGGADDYRIFKSINQGEFEEVRNIEYTDEGFQVWWMDDDILDGNTYSYYIEGYWQEESVGRTEIVEIDFWLPSCPAQYPVNNEIVLEENPEFKWESIGMNAFPFRNVIYSARGEFILFDLTEEEEIQRIEIEDFNRNSLKAFASNSETTDPDSSEVIIGTDGDNETIEPETTTGPDQGDKSQLAPNEKEKIIETPEDPENPETIEETDQNQNEPEDEDTDISPDENLLIRGHQYQWQYKVTGYDANNQAIAESITGGFFSFQEAGEGAVPEEDDDEEEYEEGSLIIDAENLSYQIIDGEDVVIARNNVLLRYNNIRLQSEYLQIIPDRNEIIASEQVTFRKDSESYQSQYLSYNWDTEKIIMDEFSGEATGDKIRGVVYYQGEKLENFPETIDVQGGFFTTCDLEEPHWHIEAEQITIYPDDKIIAKKVSWYEGKRKIFTLPSFMIFLRGKNQLPYWPKIGQNSSEGWYLKNQFNYVNDASSYGSLYLDWMQKKGIAAGIEHTFELGEEKVDDGELVLYFYGLKRKNASIYDVDTKINYWQNFENDLRLRANLVYDGTIYGGSSSQQSTHTIRPDFYLYKKWEDALLTVTGRYNLNIRSTTSSTGNIRLAYDQTITDQLKSNLLLLYTSKDSSDKPAEYQLRPEWQLKYSGSGYTLNLITEKQLSFGGDPSSKSPSTVDKLPELVFNKSSSEFMNTGIQYSITASLGNYYESGTDQKNIRGEYIINASRPFNITDHIRLTASGVYRQDVYLSGEARYLLGGKLDLRVGYQPEFYGNFSYSYYMSEGPTPFNFDTLSPLSESASASVVLKPRNDLQINLSTNYNFVSESFGSLGARVQWKPKGEHDIYLSTYYNLNQMQWNKRIDTRLNLKLSDEWKVSYSGSVYFDDFDIRNSVISVVRDLHCREISINYRQSTKAVWVDFKINAFPTETITIGQ